VSAEGGDCTDEAVDVVSVASGRRALSFLSLSRDVL
jgi:hypothetical protein